MSRANVGNSRPAPVPQRPAPQPKLIKQQKTAAPQPARIPISPETWGEMKIEFARSLLASGKDIKAWEYYTEIIRRYPDTLAAAKAPAPRTTAQ